MNLHCAFGCSIDTGSGSSGKRKIERAQIFSMFMIALQDPILNFVVPESATPSMCTHSSAACFKVNRALGQSSVARYTTESLSDLVVYLSTLKNFDITETQLISVVPRFESSIGRVKGSWYVNASPGAMRHRRRGTDP